MENVKVSIVIPCFNLGEFLDEALENIINYPNQSLIEVIVVNDGSNDLRTLEYLKKNENVYSNVRIIHQVNKGLGCARNVGVFHSKGEYIIPLDVDNKIRHVFIDDVIRNFDINLDVDVIYGNAQFFGLREGLWKAEEIDINEMVLINQIDACAGFRKKTWKSCGMYDEKMPVMGFEDWDFWLKIYNMGGKFLYINKILFDYRVRENSMIKDAWEKREKLIDYIFNKDENKNLKIIRNLIIENKKLKEEPSFKRLIEILIKKIKRKFKIN